MQMQAPELSLILPVRDIEIELPGILRSIKEQIGAAAAEWIIVDMGSDDQTVLRAVQYIKEERLQGFVIQNGKGSVSAALNTGMQKAAGEYLSFVFARRLYGGYLSSYLEAARAAQADLVFGGLDANAEQPKVSPRGATASGTRSRWPRAACASTLPRCCCAKAFCRRRSCIFRKIAGMGTARSSFTAACFPAQRSQERR